MADDPGSCVLAAARVAMALARDPAELRAWGAAHANQIARTDPPTQQAIRDAYAACLRQLKETTR